jgi:hypothetical protein
LFLVAGCYLNTTPQEQRQNKQQKYPKIAIKKQSRNHLIISQLQKRPIKWLSLFVTD